MLKIDALNYIYYKVLQAIVYGPGSIEKLQDGQFNEYIFTPMFLDCLEKFAEPAQVSFYQYLGPEDKENLYDLIAFIRWNSEFDSLEEKKQYYTQFNQIIRQLNEIDLLNPLVWYRSQAWYRYHSIVKFNQVMKAEKFEIIKTEIRQSLAYDYQVLFAHTLGEIDDPKFQQSFQDNKYYFMSLNGLIEEGQCPDICSPDIQKMIEYYQNNLTNLSREDRSFVLKQMKRFQKKLNKKT